MCDVVAQGVRAAAAFVGVLAFPMVLAHRHSRGDLMHPKLIQRTDLWPQAPLGVLAQVNAVNDSGTAFQIDLKDGDWFPLPVDGAQFKPKAPSEGAPEEQEDWPSWSRQPSRESTGAASLA